MAIAAGAAGELAGRFGDRAEAGRAGTGPPTARRADNFVQVYEQRYEHLVRVAGLIVGDPAAAEKVVRDGFVQLYRSWSRVEQPLAYLRSEIVRATCPSGRRARARGHRVPVGVAGPVERGAVSARQALGVLDRRERAAIAFRYFEDLPEAEIACALERRPATVRSLLARSLAKLAVVSRFDSGERLQQALRSSVAADGPIARPSLGELLAGERWERRSIKTLASLAADGARHTRRTWRNGRDRSSCLPLA